MEVLNRILNQVKINRNITSAASNNYKCNKCKDTTWLFNDEGKIKARCECYELDLINRMWENFGVSPKDIKPLREYKPYNDITNKARERAVDYIKSFDEIKDLRENGFCLMGQPGAGKTHIVTAIGKALLDKKIPVVYMPYIEVMRL